MRGGGRGGCSSVDVRRSTAGVELTRTGGGPAMSMAASVIAGINEHFTAQAPVPSQPSSVCFSQCDASGQHSVWAAAWLDCPEDVMDPLISAAATGNVASERAIRPANMARKGFINGKLGACPLLRQVNSS